jgi:GAF domain-containing protein
MGRGAKPAKTKVKASSPVARKSRNVDDSAGRQVEQRLTEALEQQAATSEILRVISSSRTDVQPVFDAIVRSAVRLCGADHSIAARFDGELLHPLAHHGFSPEALKIVERMFPMRPGPENMLGRAALSKAVVNLPDMLADPTYSRDYAMAGGWRSGLGVPMLRDGELIGAIAVSRREPGAFPDNLVELLKTFADQAVIAVENVRLFNEVGSSNRDLTEALEQQTATSEILGVISRSQTDVQPVFETIVAAALKLCRADSATVLTFDGTLVQIAALANTTAEGAAALRRSYPRPLGRDNAASRALLTRSVVAIPDVLEDPEYAIKDAAVAGGFRSAVSIPLIREGSPIGTVNVGRREPGPFPDKQIALLQTFADQAVIAIQNVRLFKELEARNNELRVALEHQTATSELLRVIGRSAFDLQPVFETLAENAARLCAAQRALIFRFDGQLLRFAVGHNVSPELREFFDQHPIAPGRSSNAGRAALERRTIHNHDVLSDPEYSYGGYKVDPYRTVLAVPMLKADELLGVVIIYRHEVRPFSDNQIALMETFADQAVIAIENVRLFNETREALERQTATAEILKVISSSPTDVQPVFGAIAERAAALCEAEFGFVATYDGDVIHHKASVGPSPDALELHRAGYPMKPGTGSVTARVVLQGVPVQIEDMFTDPAYAQKIAAERGGFRSGMGVPMLREGNVIGAIVVVRTVPGKFSERHVGLLQTFADQAVIAIENVRLFKELEARTTELTRSVGELKALGEVGQAVSSTLDLETVLRTIVARATQLAGMDGGSIYEYDEALEEFYLHTADRLPEEVVTALRAGPIRKGEGALGRMAMTSEPAQIRDIMADPNYQSRLREIVLRLGYRSLMAVPLMRDDHLLGGLVVYRKSPGEFDASVIDLLKTFATQSALAIQNARLFREIEDKSRQLETASRHKSEFLANMSHELRTPLNAIIGFSEVLSERLFGEINDKQAEYLTDILESGRHLLSLINDILDLSKIEAGRMELEPTDFDLPAAIENTLILVRERAQRRGITLGRTVDERLGTIRADERKLKQVLLNLLSNALKFTPEGGQIDVSARMHDGEAEISVTDTGVGIAPEDQDAVFEEFRQVGATARKVEGTGLGLAISRKFIELHGGRIWVKSQVGIGSTFAFTLPLTIDQSYPTV